MRDLNLNTRVLMFAVCTSIEFDLRKVINENPDNILIDDQLFQKAKSRNRRLLEPKDSSNYELLVELDMGDLVQVIYNNSFKFKLKIEEREKLNQYFQLIIPIRNRVMHTRPLEIGDRSRLTEVCETIGSELSFWNWNEVKKTRNLILTKPHEVFLNVSIDKYEKDTHIYHNLPIPEFDDTGFIGRKSELRELKELMMDNKTQIISVVGNGGYGKTATVVKALYDSLDLLDNPFESILWVSLKTRTLTHGEFKNISNSIKDLLKVYESIEELTVKESQNVVENIINFMSTFSTLLVIDNLETLNTEEIVNFLKQIPEKSKVLITSRHGIRELERRLPIQGLDINDALTYFRHLSNFYNLDLHKRSNEDLKILIQRDLYQSPLSIKWFLSSISKGIDEKKILANKDDLIEFCMSNVVEKLSDKEKQILQLFLVESKNLSYGEFDFYISFEESELMLALNNLISTSLISLTQGEYSMNQMAKDFLTKSSPPSNEFIKGMSEKRRKLNTLMQEIKIKNEAEPFNPKSLYKNMQNTNFRISSYHLMKALEYSAHKKWEQARIAIEKAHSIAPDYFEVYKIKAFVSAENDDFFDAIENYRIAAEMCVEKQERASVLYLFSYFHTVKTHEYEQAKDIIIEADSLYPNNAFIGMQHGRILTYLGEYQNAEEIFNRINIDELNSNKHKNQYISWFSDLYRRMAEQIDGYRDLENKLSYYEKSIEKFALLQEIDYKTCKVLNKVILDLCHLYHSKEAMNMVNRIVNEYYSTLLDSSQYTNDFTAIYSYITDKIRQYIEPDLYDKIRRISIKYKQHARSIEETNKGMVVKKQHGYGFVDNVYGSHYFNYTMVKYDDIQIGDIVTFNLMENPKGNVAMNLELSKRFE
ncbi:NB-ARC domain-containing protein (plasmid) [Planococcus maritimus]|uniref:NB-ARC domain-containing protein n=1 Tax=Planococcus maritimus TaxID=192421 RepID=UPI00313A3860